MHEKGNVVKMYHCIERLKASNGKTKLKFGVQCNDHSLAVDVVNCRKIKKSLTNFSETCNSLTGNQNCNKYHLIE